MSLLAVWTECWPHPLKAKPVDLRWATNFAVMHERPHDAGGWGSVPRGEFSETASAKPTRKPEKARRRKTTKRSAPL